MTMTTASWITRKPGRCGGDACIRDTRIPVWGLVERRRSGRSDADILGSLPGLTESDLASAWEYADAHVDEIERALWENEACMVSSEDGEARVELVRRGRQLGVNDEDIRNAFEPPLSREALKAVLTTSGKD